MNRDMHRSRLVTRPFDTKSTAVPLTAPNEHYSTRRLGLRRRALRRRRLRRRLSLTLRI